MATRRPASASTAAWMGTPYAVLPQRRIAARTVCSNWPSWVGGAICTTSYGNNRLGQPRKAAQAFRTGSAPWRSLGSMNARTPLLPAAAALALAACASAPEQEPPPAPVPVNLTKVYFYPMQGQTAGQQDRDRYDCHVWAVDQTGFDPTRHPAPREVRAAVVPSPSPADAVATGAAVGAVIGAVAAGPGDAAAGAL